MQVNQAAVLVNLSIVPRLVKWMRCFFINPDPDGSNYIDYVSMIRLAWGDEPSSINNDPDFISEFGPQQNINYPANQSDNPTLATNDSGDPDNLWPIILNQVDDGGEDDAYSDQIVYAAAEVLLIMTEIRVLVHLSSWIF